jgi:hypothetical protein
VIQSHFVDMYESRGFGVKRERGARFTEMSREVSSQGPHA